MLKLFSTDVLVGVEKDIKNLTSVFSRCLQTDCTSFLMFMLMSFILPDIVNLEVLHVFHVLLQKNRYFYPFLKSFSQ